ncbi:uncharacterized protein FIBRA_02034 [Fibroporia radiculosa]|uniref:Phosphoglycerate mutase n=1 Tax=Fibroporia radiculosa TaxID=599839 RepID=J4H1M0_9APHY|nr:uncharacterized protein FIBRA_02034 [Fibroporia radiculosa]CCM00009.1 predicted protein [Fibroporia radiculosa]
MIIARVYIVRHGETEENRLGIMQGQLDTKLNALGVKQAQLAAGALERVPFDKAYSSDLDRAAKVQYALTAEIILQAHPGVVLEKEVALRERNLGDWQGHKLDNRGSPPANIEPLTDFTLRAARWWTDTIIARVVSMRSESDGRKGQIEPSCALVVSHGGYISRLIEGLALTGRIKYAGDVKVNTKCWNASISVVDVDEYGQGVLIAYSDTTHLKGGFIDGLADAYEQ